MYYYLIFILYNLTNVNYENKKDKEIKKIITYSNEITLGFEYSNKKINVTRFADNDTLNIFFNMIDNDSNKIDINNKKYLFLSNCIDSTILELNSFFSNGFFIQRICDTSNKNINGTILIAPKKTLISSNPDKKKYFTKKKCGALWILDKIENNEIKKVRILIDINQGTYKKNDFDYWKKIMKSLIKEELTQSLGFFKDSQRYPDSIFYETPSNSGWTTEFSEMDKYLIRLLYHKNIQPKMSKDRKNIEERKLLMEWIK